MSKVAIITDSIACLPRDILEQYEIHLVTPNIYFDGKVYRDWLDISPSEVYQLLETAPHLFSTSAPPPADFVQAYRSLSSNAGSILCITLSSKVSTAYNAALLAREQVQKESGYAHIEVLDSQTVTGAEGFVVLAAARAVAEGRGLVEAVEAAKEVRAKVDLVFVLETIGHVYRTGRVPKVASRLGAWLNVKPVLTWKNGVARFIGMTRSKEKGVNQLLEAMHKRVGAKPVHVAVHHANAPEEGERLVERVRDEFECVQLWLTEFSPIMGYSTGSGALGVAFYAED